MKHRRIQKKLFYFSSLIFHSSFVAKQQKFLIPNFSFLIYLSPSFI